MKILFVTDHRKIAKAGGFVNDYLNDLTFHGFYGLWKEGLIAEIVDSTPIVSLYKEYHNFIPQEYIWGAFTACWLIDKDDICRSRLSQKIQDKYFNLVIYGSIQRCQDYLDIVQEHYSAKEIVYLDGSDNSDLLELDQKSAYFKRELTDTSGHVLPISFSMPEEKIVNDSVTTKDQEFGTVIPGDSDTYIFQNEQDYYLDYQRSYFGVTQKKAGWDCMRHYEILGNSCMPYFLDIDECPPHCLFNFPKEIVKEAMYLADWEFNETRYFELLEEALNHTKHKLTTKAIAKYILNSL